MGEPVDGTVLEYNDKLYTARETGYRFPVRLCLFRLEQSSFTIVVAKLNYTPSHDYTGERLRNFRIHQRVRNYTKNLIRLSCLFLNSLNMD
jgi:hypothetical protein